MNLLRTILKEPLVHFLAVGLVLFIAYELISGGAPRNDSDLIVVSREGLLTFMQQRTRIFGPTGVEEMLDNLSNKDLNQLIEDYVRDEVLYREAKALKLDQNDFTARQRLIQQLNFINQGVLFNASNLSEDQLQVYLQAHKARYRVDSRITFTHVYYSNDKNGSGQARARAQTKLAELRKDKVPFHKSPGHGDRFLYHRNYVNKEADEILSHFGEAMQKNLFRKYGKGKGWLGPMKSEYGFHLVLVTSQKDGYLPKLDEIRARVSQDAAQDWVKEELEKVTQIIIKQYQVRRMENLQIRSD